MTKKISKENNVDTAWLTCPFSNYDHSKQGSREKVKMKEGKSMN